MTIITQASDSHPSFLSKVSAYCCRKAMAQEVKPKSGYILRLSGNRLFDDLGQQSRKSLDDIKQRKQFPKGARLFSVGDMPCCIYLPVKGKLQIFPNDKNIVQFIEPDEIFGLTEAIANLPYEANAETLTPCLCECIGREDFISFLQTEPKICFRLLQMLGLSFQKSYQLFFLQ